MKLAIQIPCYNEEQTLAQTLNDLPLRVPIDGIEEIVVVIIDDGSHDGTAEVARHWGQIHECNLVVVRHPCNRGLAAAFQTGLDTCLALNADIIVLTDADNQYPGHFLPQLIRPILNKQFDVVIADRQTSQIKHFSSLKKGLQHWGSWVVRLLSGAKIPDTVSGFRAFSREAALNLLILNNYTASIETLFHISHQNLAIGSIPIYTNPVTRPSRLMRSIWQYVTYQASTTLRLYLMYEAFRVLFFAGSFFLMLGTPLTLGTIWHLFNQKNTGDSSVVALVLGGTMLVLGLLLVLTSLVAELINHNRRLLAQLLVQVKKTELALNQQVTRSHQLFTEWNFIDSELSNKKP